MLYFSVELFYSGICFSYYKKILLYSSRAKQDNDKINKVFQTFQVYKKCVSKKNEMKRTKKALDLLVKIPLMY